MWRNERSANGFQKIILIPQTFEKQITQFFWKGCSCTLYTMKRPLVIKTLNTAVYNLKSIILLKQKAGFDNFFQF